MNDERAAQPRHRRTGWLVVLVASAALGGCVAYPAGPYGYEYPAYGGGYYAPSYGYASGGYVALGGGGGWGYRGDHHGWQGRHGGGGHHGGWGN